MSAFGSRLTHTVSIIRQFDSSNLNDYGQPITSDVELASVRAAIQPRKAREQDAVGQGGPSVTDYVVYLFPTDLTTADAIFHDEAVCPVPNDLPTGRFEISGVPNAAGLGHHLEVACHLVAAAAESEGS